jgi:TRAP-type uncharacterized transport system fused permease subunit
LTGAKNRVKWGSERDIGKMNPFDWKNNPLFLSFMIPIIALCFWLGVEIGHSLLSGVLSIAAMSLVLFLYISRKSKKAKGEAKEKVN